MKIYEKKKSNFKDEVPFQFRLHVFLFFRGCNSCVEFQVNTPTTLKLLQNLTTWKRALSSLGQVGTLFFSSFLMFSSDFTSNPTWIWEQDFHPRSDENWPGWMIFWPPKYSLRGLPLVPENPDRLKAVHKSPQNYRRRTLPRVCVFVFLCGFSFMGCTSLNEMRSRPCLVVFGYIVDQLHYSLHLGLLQSIVGIPIRYPFHSYLGCGGKQKQHKSVIIFFTCIYIYSYLYSHLYLD